MDDELTPEVEMHALAVIDFFEGTDFNEETKALAGALMERINALLHEHVEQCRRIGVEKSDCFNSQRLAVATVLRMRMSMPA